MPKLVLLRHGQSYTNEGRQVDKEQQNLLSRTGVQQSLMNAEAFRVSHPELHFDAAFMSPYKRALQTGLNFLTMFENQPIDIDVDDRIRERSYGFDNFVSIEDLLRDYGKEAVDSWDSELYTKPSRNGETQIDVYSRVMDHFNAKVIPALQSGQNVILVAHFYVLKALKSYLQVNGPANMASFDPRNCTPYLYHCETRGDSLAFTPA
jgi:2,3-bisphosphoglycerate-dependent phosphoglycerate mutase